MKAIISVVGKDTVGILAKVATRCAEVNININEVTQTIIDEYFTMYMVVNIDKMTIPFTQFVDEMASYGKEMNLKIDCMHENIFNLMHRI